MSLRVLGLIRSTRLLQNRFKTSLKLNTATTRTMALTTAAPPRDRSVVIYTQYAGGPDGMKEYMKREMPELYEQLTFLDFDAPLSDASMQILKEAEVILMDPLVLPTMMDKLENVKWVQSTWAGIDGFIKDIDPSMLPPKFTLTRFGGRFGPHMAEYVAGQMVAHERHFEWLRTARQNKQWIHQEYTDRSYRLLKDLTMVVLGAGDIGTEIGKVCKTFGMRVMGLVRRELPSDTRSPYFDEYRTLADLPYLLGEADYVCSVLPSTPKTANLLSGDVLSHCKKKPVFINVGRGNVITENSIIQAINQHWISHAILDVVETEPLPKDSPLWTMPEVTITPHVSALSLGREVASLFYENYQLYIKGEPLKLQIDWENLY